MDEREEDMENLILSRTDEEIVAHLNLNEDEAPSDEEPKNTDQSEPSRIDPRLQHEKSQRKLLKIIDWIKTVNAHLRHTCRLLEQADDAQPETERYKIQLYEKVENLNRFKNLYLTYARLKAQEVLDLEEILNGETNNHQQESQN
jgi:hypothetical protein